MEGLVEIAPLPPVPSLDLLTYGVPEALRDRSAPECAYACRSAARPGSAWSPAARSRARRRATCARCSRSSTPPPFLPPDLLELCRWTARYYLASLADVIATIVPRRIPEAADGASLRRSSAGSSRTRTPRSRAGRRPALAPTGCSRRRRGAMLAARRASRRRLADALRALVRTRDRRGVERFAPGARAAPGRRPAASRAHRRSSAPRPTRSPTAVARRRPRARSCSTASPAAARPRCFSPPPTTRSRAGRDVADPRAGDRPHPSAGGARARALRRHGRGAAQRPRRRASAGTNGGASARGEARVVVGARSAVFAPLERPRPLVVDEEHDAAYKQEEGIRYNARDLAVVRARLAGAAVVLASATPSAESHHAALDGRHRCSR